MSQTNSDLGWEPLKDLLNKALDDPSIIPPAPIYDHVKEKFESCIGKIDIIKLYDDLYNNVTNEDEYIREVQQWSDRCPDIELEYNYIFERKYGDYESFKRFINFEMNQNSNILITNLLYYYFFGELRDYEEYKEQYSITDSYAILSGLDSMVTVPFYFDDYQTLIYIVLTSTLLISAFGEMGIKLSRNFFINGIIPPRTSTDIISDNIENIEILVNKLIEDDGLIYDMMESGSHNPDIIDFNQFIYQIDKDVNRMINDKDEEFLSIYDLVKGNFVAKFKEILSDSDISLERHSIMDYDYKLASEYFMQEDSADTEDVIEKMSILTPTAIPVRGLSKKSKKSRVSKK